jgi:hypothetical protein
MNKNFGDDYGFGIAVMVIVIVIVSLSMGLSSSSWRKNNKGEKSVPVVKQYVGIVC